MTCPTCRGAKEYMQEGCLIKKCKVCSGKGSVSEPIRIAEAALKVSIEPTSIPEVLERLAELPEDESAIANKKNPQKNPKVNSKEPRPAKK